MSHECSIIFQAFKNVNEAFIDMIKQTILIWIKLESLSLWCDERVLEQACESLSAPHSELHNSRFLHPPSFTVTTESNVSAVGSSLWASKTAALRNCVLTLPYIILVQRWAKGIALQTSSLGLQWCCLLHLLCSWRSSQCSQCMAWHKRSPYCTDSNVFLKPPAIWSHR